MQDEKKGISREELDDFWDIDRLIPDRAEKKKHASPSFDTSTVEVTSDRGERKVETVRSERLSPTEFRRFIPPFSEKDLDAPKPDREYEREGSLIHTVKIYNWQNKYSFYDRFLEDAKRLWKYRGAECPLVPFFSYSPQYAQMNKDQLSYYLWWRENARHGKYLESDYSYILLYVYELINLSELLDRTYCLDQLCGVWLGCGKKYPFIAKYLAEWVCDFCLIHDIPAPTEKIGELYPQIMKDCTLKEFYTPSDPTGFAVSARALIEISGAYDYTKSKYATPERIPVMKKHLEGALDHVMKRLAEQGRGLFTIGASGFKVIRTSYTGAHCSPTIKKKIEVEYSSFAHSYELKYTVSDVLKYSENKLRKLWGIKSRLSIYALPNEIKGYADEYFDSILLNSASLGAISRTAKRRAEELEYERLYYTPTQPLSLDRASEIEEGSWNTTKLLVDTFVEEETTEIIDKNVSCETEIAQNNDSDIKTALGEKYAFLLAVLNGDVAAQRKIVQDLGTLSEALVDEINEIAFDVIGDVIIEDDVEGLTVVEEYREQITGGQVNE